MGKKILLKILFLVVDIWCDRLVYRQLTNTLFLFETVFGVEELRGDGRLKKTK